MQSLTLDGRGLKTKPSCKIDSIYCLSQDGSQAPCLVRRGGTLGNLSLYYDLFFSSVGLLCGGILIFQGWRLDPILLLCQFLLSATTIFFIAESLWLRNNRMRIDATIPLTQSDTTLILNKKPKREVSVGRDTNASYTDGVELSYLYQQNNNESVIDYIDPIEYY